MSWRVVYASVVGSSHEARGESCQDSCVASVWHAPNGTEHLVTLVSDGAGSARLGKEGAELACKEGQRVLLETLETLEGRILSQEDITQIIKTLKTVFENHIVSVATSTPVSLRDYACTLLGAVVSPECSSFFQIGDGGIVLSQEGVLAPVFWPEIAEYANETNFLTDSNVLEHLHCATYETRVEELSLFSDGLQRLTLVYENRSAHAPFFSPMFSTMRQTAEESLPMLNEQLSVFLSSARVNERTDDDKTLVLAVWQNSAPEPVVSP
ncbi:Protein phosphatase 2C [Gammaproteobacteria bacterium]